jgi:hypothetical protein
MVRLFAGAIFVALGPGLASAQTPDVFCRFDDTQRVVICVQGDERRPVFRYEIADADLGMLEKAALPADQKSSAGSDREACRILAESVRLQQLEAKLNNSLEALRTQAEMVRASSEDNLALYKQVMIIYDALLGRYRNGVQAYQNFVRGCYVTPYPVRPKPI